MVKVVRAAMTAGLALVTMVGAARGQDAAASRDPVVRSLSSFDSIHVPHISDGAGIPNSRAQATRELRERLDLQDQQVRPGVPTRYSALFYWTLVESIDTATARTIVATAKPDSAGIVIEFADTNGNPIAAVHGSTIRAALGVLNDLSIRTTHISGESRASRPVGTYPMMHLRYQGSEDKFNLAARLKVALRQRGPWRLVDTVPAEDGPRRLETIQCVMRHVEGTLPTLVSLRCGIPSGPTAGTLWAWDDVGAEHALIMWGGSCKGCIGTDFVFTSTKTRAIAATDSLARELLEHVELEQRIYSPQRVARSR